MQDPTRSFTRGIPEALEHTPSFEKSIRGGGIIPSTWGDYASKLVEAEIVEPTVEAVCEFLFIEPEDLRDPTLHMANNSFVADMYFSKMRKRWEKEYGETNVERAEGLSKYVQELGATTWTTPEDAEEQANALQERIKVLSKASAEAWHDKPKYYELSGEAGRLCTERDMLRLGVMVSLGDFVRAVFEYPGESYFTTQELVQAIQGIFERGGAPREALENAPDTLIDNIILGKDQVDEFLYELKSIWASHVRTYADDRWEQVEPIFIAPHYSELPLFTGSEK